MNSSLVFCIALIFGGVFLVSCSKKLSPPTSYELENVSLTQPGSSTDLITMGFETYVSKCSGCHILYKPSAYNELTWNNDILPMMAPKAKLNEEELIKVKAYLFAFSEDKMTEK